MYSIKRISQSIAIKLKDNLNLDQDKYEVVEYGLFAIIHMIFSVGLIILFGTVFNVLLEALIISFTIAILRKSSGGAHASTDLSCAIIGVIFSVIPAIIFVNINIDIISLILISFFIFLLSFYLIYKLAPVDSPNKPIRSEKKIKRLKKGSLITLGIYMVLFIINVLLSIKSDAAIFKIYGLCISFGVLWQSLTLTKLGHIILNLMDSFFIEILKRKGRCKNEKVKQ